MGQSCQKQEPPPSTRDLTPPPSIVETPPTIVTPSRRPDPPPSPIFRQPWRKVCWGDKQTDLTYVKDYRPREGVQHLRVLLYGPVGAGKSSFVNSICSIFRGRVVIPAAVSGTMSDISYTQTFKTHKIKAESEDSFYPVVFNDVMGLEDGDDRGVCIDDIKTAMKGHVMEGYKFHTHSPLTHNEPGFNGSPTVNDRSHILVCVISANSAEIRESILKKMKVVREAARDLDIPQMCILTKVDEACPETESDLRNVYRSKYVKKKMSDISSSVGFPMNCIFPVKNYNEEIDLNDDIDTLILSAARRIIDFGNDTIDKR
ncbi:interferon-induced protein 44-like [Menidia menidia]